MVRFMKDFAALEKWLAWAKDFTPLPHKWRDAHAAVVRKSRCAGGREGTDQPRVLYQNGQGMPEDYVRAYMWYSLAATHSPGDGRGSQQSSNFDYMSYDSRANCRSEQTDA